eukprot:scaffold8110_cov403-Prasinococcus_capsulatus_cf.AAC.8
MERWEIEPKLSKAGRDGSRLSGCQVMPNYSRNGMRIRTHFSLLTSKSAQVLWSDAVHVRGFQSCFVLWNQNSSSWWVFQLVPCVGWEEKFRDEKLARWEAFTAISALSGSRVLAGALFLESWRPWGALRALGTRALAVRGPTVGLVGGTKCERLRRVSPPEDPVCESTQIITTNSQLRRTDFILRRVTVDFEQTKAPTSQPNFYPGAAILNLTAGERDTSH